MKGRVCILFIILLLLATGTSLWASHIVGGEVTYVNNGGGYYTVSVSIYEDCLNGDPQAIAQDNPAYLSIFNGDGSPATNYYDGIHPDDGQGGFDSIQSPPSILVPVNFTNACINNPPNTCLRKRTFTKKYFLPESQYGYFIVYQRCCRNASILNILDPNQVGATYYCIIPPASQGINNNSAVFKNYPPQIVCINTPLVYDNSAMDPDNDSLSYEFCDTYSGGSDNDAKPVPPPPHLPPALPYDTVYYRPPYSHGNPMGGYPEIQIDPVSGLITGTPNNIGRYVVTVCCHEWRNHKLINTVTREFQFVVTNCSKAVTADIPQFSSDFNTYIVNCRDYTVHFVNNSKGGFAYHWDFGIPGDTSSQFEPTFVYPDTGSFLVKLVVNPGTTCTDSISRFVKVFPKFKADYSYSGLQCPGSELMFTNLVSSTYKPVLFYNWNFGDGSLVDTAENPSHTFYQGGAYNVTLYSKNSKGCEDTLLRQIDIDRFHPFAGNDTIIVKGESIDFNATGGTQYTWSPGTFLSDTNINDPVGYYPDTGHFAYSVYVVSPFGCKGYDTVKIWVVNQASYFVPTAFSPNGDGRNDKFLPIAIGYSAINNFRVFNRWGQVVFDTKTFEVGWDGTYRGKNVEIGTYFWELSITDRYGKPLKLKGDVTLVR